MSDLVNPEIARLGAHPFPRVAALLDGVEPPPGPAVDLTIGEPRVAPPAWLASRLAEHGGTLGTYPRNEGTAAFRAAASGWLDRRFQLDPALPPEAVVPSSGAREVLFQLGLLARGKGLAVMPTPHYAPYRAAARLTGLDPVYLACDEAGGFLPDLDEVDRLGPRIALLTLCSPTNPEGAVASRGYLDRAVRLARRHGFVLAVDECYSEIYRGEPPYGVLRVCAEQAGGGDPFANVLAVNSLSKRSSAPGLRIGFAAGDRRLVQGLIDLRAYTAGTVGCPNLGAAADLLADESHVERIRGFYRELFDAADAILGGLPGYRSPEAGMFLWLRVDDGEAVAVECWERAGLRVVPGAYIGPKAHDGTWSAAGYVRVAMVHDLDTTRAALERLAPILLKHGVVA
ncbi:aminotransferase class I/II-fold pyridoxal phosphate-dependent enzyme [Glycomyces terrestris]|uniref:Aminotransferase n=1 Tax=Glycomyces terrestris TaxID=2493553 RepID=A0A426V324_9ACTN|nr:aminotransferase class I/II-fold pyridoxal phosphate-dependent enzyme [Glycomyces terrestris]RRS01228.1 aminotransferase class I/II-fold pyridoxal phosphate-dependent enzyme [Glycomyces terrestris]